MYYVVQENLPEPIMCNRYSDALAKFMGMVDNEPNKKAGIFYLGDDTALHWHFGSIKKTKA